MRIIHRICLCLLAAIFVNEAILITFYDTIPNENTVLFSLLVSSFLLLTSLFKSITIEHLERILRKKN